MSGKIAENDERVARMKEMLSKGGGKPLILPTKPKPKPRPKPAPVTRETSATSANGDSRLSSSSPDAHSEALTIELNTDSLRQFSETFDYDLDVVTRHQILDNSALLDRAALSQSKGLQNRRLPSTVANKVPEDYTSRRRAQTYVAPSNSSMKRSATQPLGGSGSSRDNVDGGGGNSVELTEEEKRQRNLAKLGIQQSNNPLSALGSILKRNTAGRGSLPRKSSKKLFDSPQSSPKTKKKSSVDSSPIGMRYGSEPPEGKNSKSGGLFKGLRRSGSRSKKKGGDNDDNRSETGSLLSLPIHSSLDEQSEDLPKVKKSPPTKKVTPSTSTPKSEAFTASKPVSKEKERTPPTKVTPQRVPLRQGGASAGSSTNRKTTDSAIFKESDYEALFSSTSESLFNTSELDKILGTKEKTPERTLDDDAAAEAKKRAAAEEEDKNNTSSMKKSVSEYNVRSNGYLGGGGGLVFPSRVEPKKTAANAGRKRSMKDQLHRYESYSRVSKSSDTTESPPVVSPASCSSRQDDVFEDSASSLAKATEPVVEQKGQSGEAIIEEEEEESIPNGQDEAVKVPEVKVTTSDGPKSSEEVAPPKEPVEEATEKKSGKEVAPSQNEPTKKAKVAGLFADVSDDDDDLFKKPSVSKKEEQKTAKKKTAALFSDEEDVADTKPPKSAGKAEKPEKDSKVEADPLGVDAEVKDVAAKADTEDASAKATPKNEESQDESLFSPSKKESSLFDDVDFEEPPRYSIRNRSRGKPNKDAQPEKADDSSTPKNSQEKEKEDDSLLSSSTSSKEKSSLFDDLDLDEPPLFNIRNRSRGRPGKDSQTEKEDDESLFSGSKSKPKTITTEEKKSTTEEVKTESMAEPPVVTGSVSDTTSDKVEKPSPTNLEDDNAEKSTPHNLSPKLSKAEKAAPEKPAKVAPKPSRKPVVPKEALTKSGTGGDGKPSWMAELKKRKQDKETEAPSSIQKKGAEIPEWQKKALEREKKKDIGKSVLSSKKEVTSPSSPRRSPRPERKADLEKSPRINRREKLANGDAPDGNKDTLSKKEIPEVANGSTSSLSPDHSSASSSKRYKTRREREREAQEKAEKEQTGDVNSTEIASRTQEEVGKKEEKSPYKTRRQREREAQELEKQQEVKEKTADKKEKEESAEERPRYKTRRQREREAREKEERDAKEREAKEKEEKEAKKNEEREEKEEREAKEKEEKVTKEKEQREAKEKEQREAKEKEQREAKEKEQREAKEKEQREAKEKEQREAKEKEQREAKEKEQREAKEKEQREAKEKEEREAKEKEEIKAKVKEAKAKETARAENIKVTSPYKTRKQREREAKEKEEQERHAKEKETTTGDNVTSSSSSNSLKDSPSRRPPLKKKPSIEIVSRRIRSGSKSSDTGGDDLKSPSIKVSSFDSKIADKKENGDMEDDVFTADSTKSPTHKKSICDDAKSDIKVKHDSEASNDPLDVKIDDFEKSNLASPQNRSAVSSPKSSVSSERDLNETRPFRSHTISSSRSPTPPGTGPLKLSDQIPEWKRKLMEKKRVSGSSPVHKPAAPTKAEQSSTADGKIPPWKRELLAKKKTRTDGKEDAPRSSRSATVSVVSPKTSSRRSKEPAPTPDFMKEFQKKKLRNNQ